MQSLKANFPLIIALISISFTLSAQADVIKANIVAPPIVDCFTTVTYHPNYPTNCNNPITLTISVSDCPPASIINKPAGGSNPIDAQECGPDGSKFCCAQLLLSQSQCGKNARVVTVYCKQ